MSSFVIYFFPFAMDIVVSLLLFVGRHSLAMNGASEAEVGSIPLCFGIGYFMSGPIMRKIISRRLAKIEMLTAIALLAFLSLILAGTRTVLAIQLLFFVVPFAASLFFNAFQAFMLGLSADSGRPLRVTVSLYTFAWSLGFALGPFVCGVVRNYFSWSQTYYLAAMGSAIMAVIVLIFKRGSAAHGRPQVPAAATGETGPLLYLPGWMGVVIGLIGWLLIATYWPVIAASTGISPTVKGLVEFAFAMAQALGALALMLLRGWQQNPLFLPFFGLLGVSALLLFGSAEAPVSYVAGASLMGLFTATTFVFSLYHCMLEVERASKRVAINEMMVGLGFVIAPAVAAALHSNGTPFDRAFYMAAGLIALLVAAKTGLALKISKARRATVPKIGS